MPLGQASPRDYFHKFANTGEKTSGLLEGVATGRSAAPNAGIESRSSLLNSLSGGRQMEHERRGPFGRLGNLDVAPERFDRALAKVEA